MDFQKLIRVIFMKKNRKKIDFELSVANIPGNPETPFQMVNKYGTYEIQPTSDTKNGYPTIAQGYSNSLEKPTKQNDAVPPTKE